MNLFNREPVPSAAEWIDSQIQIMWSKQQEDGVIEGWHGDGNFARTSIMYALWKTKGVRVRPWREDVYVGAELHGGSLHISIAADQPWQGQLVFDKPRHSVNMGLPIDYPRINQFPEWFTAESAQKYAILFSHQKAETVVTGRELQDGLPVELDAGQKVRVLVKN